MAGGARTARGGGPAEPDAHDITMKNRRRGPAGSAAHRIERRSSPHLRQACGFGGAEAASLRMERCAAAQRKRAKPEAASELQTRDHPPQPR